MAKTLAHAAECAAVMQLLSLSVVVGYFFRHHVWLEVWNVVPGGGLAKSFIVGCRRAGAGYRLRDILMFGILQQEPAG